MNLLPPLDPHPVCFTQPDRARYAKVFKCEHTLPSIAEETFCLAISKATKCRKRLSENMFLFGANQVRTHNETSPAKSITATTPLFQLVRGQAKVHLFAKVACKQR